MSLVSDSSPDVGAHRTCCVTLTIRSIVSDRSPDVGANRYYCVTLARRSRERERDLAREVIVHAVSAV